MLIKKIKIQNLKVLHDFELDLSSDSDRLVFVNGFNNHGKTTLLRGIAFALFGADIPATDVSEKTDNELGPNSTCQVSTLVQLELDDQSTAHISRDQYFKKSDKGELRQSGTPSLRISLVDSDDRQVSKHMSGGEAELWLEENFPKRFQPFIIFDGEEMEKFLDSGLNELIEKAVRQVANIDSFDQTIESLKKRKRLLEKELVKFSNQPNAEDLLKQKNEAEDLYEDRRAKYQELVRERDNLAIELNRLEPRIAQEQDNAKLIAEKNTLNGQIKTLIDNDEAIKTDLNQYQWSVGIKSFLANFVEDELESEIELAISEERYPTQFQPAALQKLIESGRCICNRPLDHEASEQIHLQIQRHLKAAGDGEILNAWKTSLTTFKGVLSQDVRNRDKKADYRRTQSIELRNAQGRLAEIDRTLDAAGSSGSQDGFLLRYTTVKNRHDKIVHYELEPAKEAMEWAESEKRQAEKDYLEMAGKSGLSSKLTSQVSFLTSVISESENFGESILASIKKELEAYLSEHVQEADQGRYRTYIDDEFQLQTVMAESGRQVKLSEGQKMMRAYFFSFALRSVIELNLPLIVDSPLMRLDGKNTKRMVTALGSVFNGPHGSSQQAMFMMTDKEYSPPVRELFADSFPIPPRETYLWHQASTPEYSELREGLDPDWFLQEFGPWFGQKGGK